MPTSLMNTRTELRPRLWPSHLPGGILVAVWAVLVYGGLNLVRGESLPPQLSYLLIQPLMWLSLAAAAFASWRLLLGGRPAATPELAFTGVLTGVFQVALWLLAGVAFGFGYSPFEHSLPALATNLIHVGTALLAIELTRTVLVSGVTRHPLLAVLGTSLFLTWLRMPPARWDVALETQSVGPFLGEMLLPYLAEDVLASTLALLGGPLPSLLYRAVLLGHQWLFPILPQLPWTVTAFVGTLAPALGLIMLQAIQAPAPTDSRRGLGLPVAGMAAVALLWFNVGLFGVRPTLISGGSMEPAMTTGDIAVVRDVPPEEILVGDIVQFQHEGVHVVHRVVEVRHEPEGPVFVTQGDANNRLDPPIPAERLDGKVVLVIRKLGWIGIGLRQVVQWIS